MHPVFCLVSRETSRCRVKIGGGGGKVEGKSGRGGMGKIERNGRLRGEEREGRRKQEKRGNG